MSLLAAYIGIGANLGDPAAQVRHALHAIAQLPGVQLRGVSRFYGSAPMGPADQPDFCNAVCRVDSRMAPAPLLQALIGIEREAGRVRGAERWGPRLLDLDLLHVEGVALDEPGLHLPHPGLAHRNFVLVPLAELAPALHIPGVGVMQDLAARMSREGLWLWPDDDARAHADTGRP